MTKDKGVTSPKEIMPFLFFWRRYEGLRRIYKPQFSLHKIYFQNPQKSQKKLDKNFRLVLKGIE
jgi:hypothetical protein